MTPDTGPETVQAPSTPADPARASADGRASPAPFMVTKEHRRFAEFADAVRRDRYIGLCYGAPGVGKTLSARHYAGWDTVEPYLRAFSLMESVPAPGQALASRSIVYTRTVANTPRTVDKGVTFYHTRLSWGMGLTLHPGEDLDARAGFGEANEPFAELLIADEADRLKTPALEQLRDHHDRTGIGLILIGMPGIEKRLARYPSSTAGSDSSTTTGRYPPRNKRSCWPGTGPNWALATHPTSPPARQSPRSPASPPGTSA